MPAGQPGGTLAAVRTTVGTPLTARIVQGMARVRSEQAPAWLLVSDRSVRIGSGVKYDFA